MSSATGAYFSPNHCQVSIANLDAADVEEIVLEFSFEEVKAVVVLKEMEEVDDCGSIEMENKVIEVEAGIEELDDDALGYVYYSDEGFGVRKYYADPEKGNIELAVFGQTQFKEDHEGISIYQSTDSTGYILVSDQQTNYFHVFTREGTNINPHEHKLVTSLHLSTQESDGSDVVSEPLNAQFQKGLFVAMSTDKSFQYYRWEDLMK